MYVEKFRLDGKVALVVGAGGNRMGTETCVALSEAGAMVAGIDITDEQMVGTKERIESEGGLFHPFVANVFEIDTITRAFDEIWERFGVVDHFIYVVGGTRPHQWFPIDKYPDQIFDEVLSFNLRPLFQSCREISRRMIDHDVKGTIVNFTSTAGLYGAPLHGAYGAAKAGVVSLTKTMAVELGPHGIRVNAVAAGNMESRRAVTREIKRDPTWNPLQRGVYLSEMASTALFLTTELSSGITGQTINIDAGATARSPLAGLDVWSQNATVTQ